MYILISKTSYAFADDILAAADPSDMWDDIENGKKYIVIETDGFNKKAEKELIATVKKIAPKHGYQFVADYKSAQKLGIGNAYADDALLVYVGK